MTLNHNEYLNYTLPNNWCAEEDIDNLLLYNPSGNGAITTSFFNYGTTLIISKKPGNTGISRDIRTEFTTDLLLSD